MPRKILVAGTLLTALLLPASAAERDAVAACPRLAGHLQDELEFLVGKLEESGRMQVRFRVHEGRPVKLEITGGPLAYRARLRAALATLRCQGLAADAVYVFDIEFRDS